MFYVYYYNVGVGRFAIAFHGPSTQYSAAEYINECETSVCFWLGSDGLDRDDV